MEDWAEIRCLHRAEGVPIEEIVRRLGVARNVGGHRPTWADCFGDDQLRRGELDLRTTMPKATSYGEVTACYASSVRSWSRHCMKRSRIAAM